MTIKELIKQLKSFPLDTRVLVANDEELNSIMKDFDLATMEGIKTPSIVIFPISGSEIDEINELA